MHQVFVLTPYKMVTAHFLAKYLDSRDPIREMMRIDTQIHHQVAFQLMMSLDLAFEELLGIIQKPLILRDPNDETGTTYKTEIIDKDFLSQFRVGLGNLTNLTSLTMFMDRIDFTKDANDKEWAEMMRKHCHPKSMIGMFLRRIVIHFKRLSFNETSMLVHNLESYIRLGEPVPETPGSKSEEIFKFPEVKSVPSPPNIVQGPSPTSGLSLENLRAIEKKLILQHRSTAVKDNRKREVELRHQIFVLSKIIEERELALQGDTNSTAEESDEICKTEVSQDDSVVQSEDTWNQSSRMTDSTVKTPGTDEPNTNPTDSSGEDQEIIRKAPLVTQQYLIHQVNMIMNNEKRSLPPENILQLVEHFYKKQYLFQYQQSIHSNYRMNVRMNHRNTQLDSASSLTNSDNQDGNDITNIFSKNFGHVQSTNNFHK